MAWTEPELVQQALEGDRDAFGKLVERHRRTVYALALQRGFQPAEAEDVAQEVFIKAYRSLTALKDRELFERWLYGIAAHVMADAARARRRRAPEQSASEDMLDGVAREDGYVPPHDRAPVGLAEDTARVLGAMGSLSEEHRLAVTLRYLHGLSPKDIAERLHEPRGTVRSRIHHALLHLQKALGVPARKNASARAQRPDGGPGV